MSFPYTQSLLDNAFTYDQYRQHIADELAQDVTDEKTEKLLRYTRKNAQLMDELGSRYTVNDHLLKKLIKATPATWLVLTEGWCGDAAFANPLFRAIENIAPEKVQLLFVLKDSHTALMDAHLTNGGRSIPKLIVLNHKLEELATWGPRPAALQSLMSEWKRAEVQLPELIEKVHKWYHHDDTRTTQDELGEMIAGYSGKGNIERLEELNRLIETI